jgi:hypothetical protein
MRDRQIDDKFGSLTEGLRPIPGSQRVVSPQASRVPSALIANDCRFAAAIAVTSEPIRTGFFVPRVPPPR